MTVITLASLKFLRFLVTVGASCDAIQEFGGRFTKNLVQLRSRARSSHLLGTRVPLRNVGRGLILYTLVLQVHYYYDFSDHVLPPSVPINRPFKILMDQSIYFCSKCTMYIALVSTEEYMQNRALRKMGKVLTLVDIRKARGWRDA